MRVADNQGSLDTGGIAKCPRRFVAVNQRWRIIEWRIIEGLLYIYIIFSGPKVAMMQSVALVTNYVRSKRLQNLGSNNLILSIIGRSEFFSHTMHTLA